MEVKELKFLLKLVGQDNYRGKIQDLKPNSKTKMSETRSICRSLRDRELVTCSETITKIKISSAGKGLLKTDAKVPLDANELKILKACATQTITPTNTNVSPAKKRDELIASLVERGLIIAAETKIEQVWLENRGKEVLAKEYIPSGSSTLSLNLVGNYLSFLRKYFKHNGHDIDDDKILQTIKELELELNTGNYLPIFHLRDKLQSLSRKDLDDALYRLQRQDELELGSLTETVKYTPEQIKAGIPQNTGGALFFLTVN